MKLVSRINFYLFIIFIFLMFIIIIVFPRVSLNYYPSGYDACIDYGRYYIINHGNISPTENTGTWQGLLSNYGSEDVLSKILFASINIITGIENNPDDLRMLNIFIFGKILLMPLFGYLIYLKISKFIGSYRIKDGFFIAALTMLPIASSLPSSTTSGVAGNVISMALIMLIFVYFIDNNSIIKKSILFLLLTVFMLFWHTWSIYLLVFLLIFYVMAIVLKEPAYKNNAFIAIIMYFSIGTYLNFHQLILSPVAGLSNIVGWGSFFSTLNYETGIVSYQTGNSYYSIIQIICSTLLIIPIIIVGLKLLWIKSHRKISHMESFILMINIGLVGCWIALLLQGGLYSLLMRALEPAIPVSIFNFSYIILSRGQKKPKSVNQKYSINKLYYCSIYIIIIFLVTSCIFSYYNRPESPISLDENEFVGLSFTGAHVSDDSHIFSDFRIVPILIRYDKHYLYTPDQQTQNHTEFYSILSIYYNNSTPSENIQKIMPLNNYYVVISQRQSEWGILDSYEVLKPANIGFESNFILDDGLNIYYSNGNLICAKSC
ncbi:MAG: hypothetical protein AB9860_03610 [Methanomassiliicoccales archaeon]